MPVSPTLRLARREDVDSLIEIDPIARRDPGRRQFIAQAVANGQCWVATAVDEAAAVLGYGVLNRAFFEHDFIPLVMVRESARRRGIAMAIVRGLAQRCQGAKLFTSTNTSNIPMRNLLGRLGFIESGRIENLDDQDPEMIFVRR